MINVTTDGDVLRIEFASAKANSLSAAMLHDLGSAFEDAGRDGSAAKVIALTSAGDGAFCAGASFDDFQAIRDEVSGAAFFGGFGRVLGAMRNAPQPIVVRVQGKVVGGGAGIVAAADYAVAHASASIRLSELELGIGPFVVAPSIERRIGTAHLSAMALDCAWRDAAWARDRGLYSAVEETAEALDARFRDTVATLASRDRDALRALKAALWHGTPDWAALLADRARTSGRLAAARLGRTG